MAIVIDEDGDSKNGDVGALAANHGGAAVAEGSADADEDGADMDEGGGEVDVGGFGYVGAETESTPIFKTHRNRGGVWRRLDGLRNKWRTSSSSPSSPSTLPMEESTASPSSSTSSSSSSSSSPSCMSDRIRRRCCFVIIGCYLFLDGLEGGFIIPTLWLLLENKFHLRSDGYFLGFTVSSFCAASLIFSPIAGKFSDLMRTAKPLLLLSCLIRVASNSLYFISYSKWFVYAGRVLSGVGAAVTPALIADVARATKAEERTKVINYIFILRNIGNVAGYIVIPLFPYVDFDFFGVPVNKLNASGFFAAILFLVTFFLTLALYFDLSKSSEGGDRATNERGDGEETGTGRPQGLTASSLASSEEPSTSTTYADDEEEKKGKEEKRGCWSSSCCCLPAGIRSSVQSSWIAFKENLVREELLIVFLTGFVSMFNLGSIETALFPFLEYLFNWTIFKHPFLFFGALLSGILLLILIFRIGQNFNERSFYACLLVMSCAATLFCAIVWSMSLVAQIRDNSPQVMWELLVGGGAFLLIILVNGVCIICSAFLSLIFPLESQGIGQGYLQTVKMVGNMLGPLWAGAWLNVPLFLGVQLALLSFIVGLFGFSWREMDPKIYRARQQEQEQQQQQQQHETSVHPDPELPPPPGIIQ